MTPPLLVRPIAPVLELKIGETGLAYYEAINNSDQPISGMASHNVAPEIAGYYFSKMECFCFPELAL